MSLSQGAMLGPYEVLSAAGAGGMGEVYRCRDTRLGRIVAIKILPDHLSSNSELRQRFEREARAISLLQHPHICVLHDIGSHNGTSYLVMEYLEGETLAQRLHKGPLPLDQLLRIGIEVADGLNKAHCSGMIHRDLKPANIMLTKSGAKLMDFGLARALTAPAGAAASAQSGIPSFTATPTMTSPNSPLTAEGTIVGTLNYMSPEQIQGKEADARSDVFAFGAVLYEMTTGKRAFEGKSQISVASAILEKEPEPIAALQPLSPPALQYVVETCLKKDPAERFQSAHDIKSQLRWTAESCSHRALQSMDTQQKKLQRGIAWAVVALALAVIVIGILSTRVPTSQQAVEASSILAPDKAAFAFYGPNGGPPALSPDGQFLTFSAQSSDGKYLLWVRPLSELAAQPLRGTDGASFPFWSPDSRSIGFFAHGQLETIDVNSGRIHVLSTVSLDARGGTWGSEGIIVYSPSARDGLYRIPATGGAPERASTLDPSAYNSHRWPWFLPDGRHFLYLASNLGTSVQDIYVGSIDGKESRLVLQADSNVIYSQGYLLFLRQRTLMAQPFDSKRLSVTGEPTRVAEDVDGWRPIRQAFFSASQNGQLVYETGNAWGISRLLLLNRAGQQLKAVGDPLPYLSPALSPDGLQLAVTIEDPTVNLWIYDLSRGVRTRFTSGRGPDIGPVWSRDSEQIVFASNRGQFQIYQKGLKTGTSEAPLLQSDAADYPTDWSADGRYIAFQRLDTKKNNRYDIWVLPTFGDRKPFAFAATQFDERAARFSPDGKWMAYSSDESGETEVYVASFPAGQPKIRISTAGGDHPRWRRDGKEIFFISTDQKVMAAEVGENSSGLKVDEPRALFGIHARKVGTTNTIYDVSADGQKFLVNSLPDVAPPSLTLVTNWSAQLRK
jgi:serine/threonine protein kinase